MLVCLIFLFSGALPNPLRMSGFSGWAELNAELPLSWMARRIARIVRNYRD
jgi:hypothetical protein